MSTIPPLSGPPLYRYIPGVGRVAAVECGTGSGVTGTCATAFSTSDQSLVAGTAANVAHDTVPFSYGITVVTGANGYFQVPTTGIYKIIPSLQILGAGNGRVTIWIKVNGTNVPDSATLTLFKNGEESVITCEYLLELTANDQVQVWVVTASANGSVEYHASGGSGDNAYPAAPGVITNIYRIR